jgi:AcrR family transcriptional regulator
LILSANKRKTIRKQVIAMARKQSITKESLLDHAFKIAEEQGILAVTSRSVAQAAGCSIQPVFSHFPTMEELRKQTFL